MARTRTSTLDPPDGAPKTAEAAATPGREVVDSLQSASRSASPAEPAAETPVLEGASAAAPAGSAPAGSAPTGSEEPASFIQQLSEFGFSDVQSDQDAQSRVLDLLRQQKQEMERMQSERESLQQFANYGRQYVEELQQGGRVVSGQQPTAAPQETKSWWTPPHVEMSWYDRYREIDPETQAVRWKRDTPASVVSAAQAFETHVQDWAAELATRPQEAFHKGTFGTLREHKDELKQLLQPLIEEIYASRRSVETEQDFLSRIEQENAEWLYQVDPRTNQPQYGKWSPDGAMIVQFMNAERDAGIASVQEQWNRARDRMELQLLRSSSQQDKTAVKAQQTAQEMRHEHVRRAAASKTISPRGGSVTRRETREPQPQNANLSMGQQLVQQMEEEGVAIP